MRYGLHKFISTLLLCILILGMASQGAEDSSGTVLKIGTPNVVKSASILGRPVRGASLPLPCPDIGRAMPESGPGEGLAPPTQGYYPGRANLCPGYLSTGSNPESPQGSAERSGSGLSAHLSSARGDQVYGP